jgi:hypothetical protein
MKLRKALVLRLSFFESDWNDKYLVRRKQLENL